MHFKNEADINKNACNSATKSSSTSCSSSTDSGVIMIDNHSAMCGNIDDNDANLNNCENTPTNEGILNNSNKNQAKLNNKSRKQNHTKDNLNSKRLSYINNTNEPVEKLTNKTSNLSNECNSSSHHVITDDGSNIRGSTKKSKNDKSELQNEEDLKDETDSYTASITIENIKNITKSGTIAETTSSKPKVNERKACSPSCKRRSPTPPNLDKLESDGPSIHFSTVTYSPASSVRSTTISIGSIDENAVDSSIVDSDSEQDADAEGVHSKYIVKKLGQQTTYPPQSTDLSNLNRGLKVVGQTIHPQGADNVGPLAEKVLNGNLCVPSNIGEVIQPVRQPQIGSVALTNSTDVTFGDKHFYEGPVTIQQFLVNRAGSTNDDPKSGTSSAPAHEQPYPFIFNKKALITAGIIILLTVVIGVIVLTTSNVLQTQTSDDSFEDIELTNGTLKILSKSEWGGKPAKKTLDKLQLPVHRVIISHTASDTCHDNKTCSTRCQVIQLFHMNSLSWDDIGYNFLVGGDGFVYEGRGWNNQGAHTKGYNTDSVGITFIGTFNQIKPTQKQILAAKLLMEEGVRLKKLVPNYKLFAHRQLSPTESPGDIVVGIIQKWPNFSTKI